MSGGLTMIQRRTLDFIGAYERQHGWSPSCADIAAGIGRRSRTTAVRILRQLERRGFITRTAGTKRSIETVRGIEKLRLPDDLDAELRRIAACTGVSVAEALIEAARDGLVQLRARSLRNAARAFAQGSESVSCR